MLHTETSREKVGKIIISLHNWNFTDVRYLYRDFSGLLPHAWVSCIDCGWFWMHTNSESFNSAAKCKWRRICTREDGWDFAVARYCDKDRGRSNSFARKRLSQNQRSHRSCHTRHFIVSVAEQSLSFCRVVVSRFLSSSSQMTVAMSTSRYVIWILSLSRERFTYRSYIKLWKKKKQVI